MAEQTTYKTCISCGKEGFTHWQLFQSDRRDPTCRYCGARYVSVHRPGVALKTPAQTAAETCCLLHWLHASENPTGIEEVRPIGRAKVRAHNPHPEPDSTATGALMTAGLLRWDASFGTQLTEAGKQAAIAALELECCPHCKARAR